MRISEPSVNAILADLLFERLSGWFSSVVSGRLVQHRRAELDVFLADIFGLKVVVEAKLGYTKINDAVGQCKNRLSEGLADICIAIAYSEKTRSVSSADEVRQILESDRLRVKVVFPDSSVMDLGEVTLNTLIDVLNKHRIYDRIVGKELVEELAKDMGNCLDRIRELDRQVLERIASIVEKDFEIRGGGNEFSEEEDEE